MSSLWCSKGVKSKTKKSLGMRPYGRTNCALQDSDHGRSKLTSHRMESRSVCDGDLRKVFEEGLHENAVNQYIKQDIRFTFRCAPLPLCILITKCRVYWAAADIFSFGKEWRCGCKVIHCMWLPDVVLGSVLTADGGLDREAVLAVCEWLILFLLILHCWRYPNWRQGNQDNDNRRGKCQDLRTNVGKP